MSVHKCVYVRESERIHQNYSVGPSIPPIYTRCCFTTTDMGQLCSNFRGGRAFNTNTRPDDIAPTAVERTWHT